jgi:hypothetical protein
MFVELGPTGLVRRVATNGAEAVRAGAGLINQHIRSQTQLRFGLYALASLFVIVAALLVVFAPDGREAVSSIVAVALFVVAVGCAGFGTFAIKTPVVSAEAGIDVQRPANDHPPPNSQSAEKPRRRRPPAA